MDIYIRIGCIVLVHLFFKAKESKLKYINIKDRQIQDNRIKTHLVSKVQKSKLKYINANDKEIQDNYIKTEVV